MNGGGTRAFSKGVVQRGARDAPASTGERRAVPLFAASRLLGLDAARGLAIVGMLVVHLTMPTGLLLLPAGRSSALFAVLAGASLVLIAGSRDTARGRARRRARTSVALRGLVLTAIGLGLWCIPGLPFAVIIDEYGVLFILLVPLLFARRRVLVLTAAVFAGAGAGVVGAVGFQYVSQEQRFLVLPSVWLITGQYPGLVFIVYVLIGMIAARSDLRRRSTRVRVILAGGLMSAIGYGVGAVVPGQTASPHSNTTWEVLGDGGVALIVIGVLQLASRAQLARLAMTPVAVMGSMSLTVYILQVLAVLLWPFSYLSWSLLVLLLVGSIGFSLLWRRFIGRGPVEALVARLSLRSRAGSGSRGFDPNVGCELTAASGRAREDRAHARRPRPGP